MLYHTDTDFKFDKHVLWDSPDMTFTFFSKRGVPRVTFPLYFWALNANFSNTVKVTDFKFQKHVPWADSKRISMTGSAVLIQYTRVTDVRTTELPWHTRYNLHIRPGLLSLVKQESCAKMTAQCALYTGAVKICPRV